MPELLDENLTPEELRGGFEPTDKDDETFLLETLESYPGQLPYDIDFSDENKTFEETLEEATGTVSLDAPKEHLDDTFGSTETPSSVENEEAKPYEKAGLVEKEQQQVYEKSGVIADDVEQTHYEKAGLVADDVEQTPYEKAGLVDKDAIEYEKSGLVQEEAPNPEESDIHSVWDLFEKETESASEIEEIREETENRGEYETTATEDAETEEALESEKSDAMESVGELPVEIKVADFDENEFKEVLDEDFRKEIRKDLEQHQEKKTKIEQESKVPAAKLSTAEKEELQRDLDEGKERIGTSDFIEIDLTAMKVKKPSEFLAYETKADIDFEKLLKESPRDKKKEKKDKKQRREKKKEKKAKTVEAKQAIATESAEISAKAPKEESKQIVEPISREEIERAAEKIIRFPKEKTEETKTKKRLIPIWAWLSSAAIILLFITVGGYFLLDGMFRSKKEPKIAKSETPLRQMQKRTEPRKTAEPPKDITLPTAKEALPPSQEKTIQRPTIEAKSGAEQITKKERERESKPKVSLNKQIKTESSRQKTQWPEKPLITEAEKLTKPQEAKIIETVPLAEYSIEVFSSSEPDEANYWKNILNKKGIDALIKVHKVRNVNVYCVRVGTFKSVDEAKTYAKSMGFKNIWIDRIR